MVQAVFSHRRKTRRQEATQLHEETMKVSIWSDGDRSVGINGFSATVDIGDFLTDNKI